jgi:hypothetical protein
MLRARRSGSRTRRQTSEAQTFFCTFANNLVVTSARRRLGISHNDDEIIPRSRNIVIKVRNPGNVKKG